MLSQGASSDERGHWYSAMVGRAAEDVTGVDVLMSDGSRVHASVRSGWWAAWWPGREAGSATGLRITVHTSQTAETYSSDQL